MPISTPRDAAQARAEGEAADSRSGWQLVSSLSLLPPPRAGEGRGGGHRGIREDRRDIDLAAVDGDAHAGLAKVGPQDVRSVLRRGHPPGLCLVHGIVKWRSPLPVDV